MQVVQSFHLEWQDVPDTAKLVSLLGSLLEEIATLSPAVALLIHFKVSLTFFMDHQTQTSCHCAG